MKLILQALVIFTLGCVPAMAVPNSPFYYNDGLAPRDEWGRLYQSPNVLPSDLEPRYSVRYHYYYRGARTLQNDPAYVAAIVRPFARCDSARTSTSVLRSRRGHTWVWAGSPPTGIRRVDRGRVARWKALVERFVKPRVGVIVRGGRETRGNGRP